MKMKKVVAIALTALLGALSANAAVIFKDVFDGGEAGPGDLNQNLVARQAGGTTSSTYTLNGTLNASTEILSGVVLSKIDIAAGNDFALLDLDTDFGPSLAGHVWSISYDGDLINSGASGPEGFGGWAGFFIGGTRGFGADFGVIFRPDGAYSVFSGFTEIDLGTGLSGVTEAYSVKATFNETLNTVSLFHMSSGGGTNLLGTYPQVFAGGSRYVQFRSHVDGGDEAMIIDSYLDNVMIETLPVPTPPYVFHDSFDTGDTNINVNIESRQADGAIFSEYFSTNGGYSISGNKLLVEDTFSKMQSTANFAPWAVGRDFELSFKLTMTHTGTGWVSIHLLDDGYGPWGNNDFGVLARGLESATAFLIGDLADTNDPNHLADISVIEMTQLLGYEYDKSEEHAIQFVSTASVDGTNSYDFVVDGVVIRSNLLYADNDDTVRRIDFFTTFAEGVTGGAFIEDLSLKLIEGATYEDWVVDDTGLTVGVNDARTADPDKDSMDNLLEYALGGDPLVDDAESFLPTFSGRVESGGTNYLNYVYRRRVDAGLRGLAYSVNVKFNLETDPWSDLGDFFEENDSPIDLKFVSVANYIPLSHSDEAFVTLKVTEEIAIP